MTVYDQEKETDVTKWIVFRSKREMLLLFVLDCQFQVDVKVALSLKHIIVSTVLGHMSQGVHHEAEGPVGPEDTL